IQQDVERVLVAGEEDLFLVPEVIIEVALVHLERGGDFFHRRAVVAAPPEGGRRALENLDPGLLTAPSHPLIVFERAFKYQLWILPSPPSLISRPARIATITGSSSSTGR